MRLQYGSSPAVEGEGDAVVLNRLDRAHKVPAQVDAVIVGAGFAGLYAQWRLARLGLSVQGFEAGTDVGGTWYWNRYPGARCDVESLEYSYSFSPELLQEWEWTEKYATQPEILSYIEHVATRFDLRRRIRFSTQVTSAEYQASEARWLVRTDQGDEVSARFCIMATGCLSLPRKPDFPGLDSFQGRVFHTGDWPHEGVDFSGRRVGVIGTGSSGIQAIPLIAEQAGELFVFQRTPNFSVPAHNQPMEPAQQRWFKDNSAELRDRMRRSAVGTLADRSMVSALAVEADERERVFEAAWRRGGAGFTRCFADLLTSAKANEFASEFVRNKIRSIVKDSQVAELLCPRDYPLGAKRICVDTNYYATFNRTNVRLVDVRRAPIMGLVDDGLRTSEQSYALDDLVFATGYDAVTGALLDMSIRGEGGLRLQDKWSAGPETYLGLMTAGFPNLFLITGPGSPSVLSNMVLSIEQHVDWIANCVGFLVSSGKRAIEATAEAERGWTQHVAAAADKTLFPRAASWFLGANVPGKPRVFLPYAGGVDAYGQKCREVEQGGYPGFCLS